MYVTNLDRVDWQQSEGLSLSNPSYVSLQDFHFYSIAYFWKRQYSKLWVDIVEVKFNSDLQK